MRAAAIVPCLCLAIAVGQDQTAAEAARAGWRSDLRLLRSEIERMHPDPFHAHPREEWDRAVKELEHRIPQIDEGRFVVELMRIVKLAEDGHTTLMPIGSGSMQRSWPIAFWGLAEGVVVRAAAKRYADLVGCRVLAVAGVPMADVLERIATVTPGDDPKGSAFLRDRLLSFPGLLRILGVGTGSAPFVLSAVLVDGTQAEFTLYEPEPGPPAVFGPRQSDWTVAMPSQRPVWLGRPTENYWFEELPGRAMYLRFRQVLEHEERPFRTFCEELFAAIDARGTDKLIVDLRGNTGGNNEILQPLIHGLIRADRVNRPGHLFVLTNGITFSAAVNCAARIERETHALFVGEPTGAGPNSFGDATAITLPATGCLLRVSTLRWQDSHPRDRRRWIAPDLSAPMTLADYLAGRDPALTAALAHTAPEAADAGLLRRWTRPSQANAVPR